MKRSSFLVVVGLALSGCNIGGIASGNAAAYCDLRTKENRCQERVGSLAPAAESFKSTCKAIPGDGIVAGDGTCPAAGKVGGCLIGEQGDGSDVNDWYYAPKTRAEAEAECADESGTFLPP